VYRKSHEKVISGNKKRPPIFWQPLYFDQKSMLHGLNDDLSGHHLVSLLDQEEVGSCGTISQIKSFVEDALEGGKSSSSNGLSRTIENLDDHVCRLVLGESQVEQTHIGIGEKSQIIDHQSRLSASTNTLDHNYFIVLQKRIYLMVIEKSLFGFRKTSAPVVPFV